MSNFEYANATDEQLMDWELANAECGAWDQECAQTLWAEAGGYAAGICRPSYYGH